MQCARCAGLRVPEIICEGGTRILALRCLHCGDVIDRVIVLNRQRRRLPHPSRARTRSRAHPCQPLGEDGRLVGGTVSVAGLSR